MRRSPVWAVAAFALALTGLARSAAGEQPTKPPVVRALAFSPDGKVIVAGYGGKDQPGGVAAWDVAGRKRVWHRPEPTGALSVRFAPDGRSLTVARGTPAAVRLEPANGQPLGELGPHPADVRSVAYVLGGDLLATASDGIIRLWDVKAGTVRKELTGHPHEVTSLVASPTGRWLVSIGPDTTRVWDVAAGEDLKGVIRQDRGIAHRGIAFFGPDWLQMGDNSGVQRITELPAGKEVLRFHNAGGCDGAAYSPAAGLAAFRWSGSPYVSIADLTFRPPAADEQVRIDKLLKDFDDDSYAVREAATAAFRQVGSVAEPALRQAATGGPSAEVRMRARETRRAILDEPIRKLTGHTGNVGPMAFSPDGKILATGADDGTVRLWDPQTGKDLARFDVSDPAAPGT